MSGNLRIALAQFDFPVGAISANTERIAAQIVAARDDHGAEVVVFPELALSGRPAQDLLLRPAFLQECAEAVERIAGEVQGITALVGWPQAVGDAVFNAVSVLCDGKIERTLRQARLSPDRTLDTHRYFTSAPDDEFAVFTRAGVRFGVLIGADLDGADGLNGLAAKGVELVLVPAATAFAQDETTRRAKVLIQQAQDSGVALAWLNLVGGQDELIFDGGALVVDGNGHAHPPAKMFESHWLVVDFDPETRSFSPRQWKAEVDTSRESLTWRALVCGTRDYLNKNGFRHALLGLSGGVDSALVLAIAVDALGAENVTAVRLPSRYTVGHSNDLAEQQAVALGVQLHTLSIEKPFSAFLATLAPLFSGHSPDVTEENLQSRCRGVLLMALSNKFGGMLLSTGNKSEQAVGYGTIYGDMCGGYAPIKDIFKTEVFELCRWRNLQGDGERIPEAVITRPPSAELREDQLDTDSLPPYSVLDALLARHLDEGEGAADLVAAGFDVDLVQRVLRLVRISEWKRHQAAPGPMVTIGSLGRGRRYPISSGWS